MKFSLQCLDLLFRPLSIACAALALMMPALVSAQLVVDSLGNADDAAIDGSCATAGGDCSLKAAIQEANANADLTTINFSITGCPDGVCVIEIASDSPLPDITAPVFIDGTTQGNPEICSSAIPERPPYLVVLDGDTDAPAVGIGSPGLRLEEGSDGSTIRGLNVRNFTDGIAMINTSDSVVACNFVGTNNEGTASGAGFENSLNGIIIGCVSNENTIGGLNPGDGNLLSGNRVDGIQILGDIPCPQGSGPPAGNAIAGNYIGVNAAGTAALGNQFSGISMFGGDGPDNNLIGFTAGQGAPTYNANVISANGTGVYIGTSSTSNRVEGNVIGTDLAGSIDLGNSFGGVEIEGTDNQVGSSEVGGGNTIAFNVDAGVIIWGDPAVNNRIQQNSIYSNQGIGIDLAPEPYTVDGVTPNDPGDTDTGPNDAQNFPVITRAQLNGTDIEIEYSIDSPTPLTVEWFLADTDNQEGEVFLASDNYAAAGNRLLIFPATGITAGDQLVATATNANNSTSEFSAPVRVQAAEVVEPPVDTPAVPVPINATWAMMVLILLMALIGNNGYFTNARQRTK